MAVWLKQLDDHVDIIFASSNGSVRDAIGKNVYEPLMIDPGVPGPGCLRG